jgi:hypothetical protein
MIELQIASRELDDAEPESRKTLGTGVKASRAKPGPSATQLALTSHNVIIL